MEICAICTSLVLLLWMFSISWYWLFSLLGIWWCWCWGVDGPVAVLSFWLTPSWTRALTAVWTTSRRSASWFFDILVHSLWMSISLSALWSWRTAFCTASSTSVCHAGAMDKMGSAKLTRIYWLDSPLILRSWLVFWYLIRQIASSTSLWAPKHNWPRPQNFFPFISSHGRGIRLALSSGGISLG